MLEVVRFGFVFVCSLCLCACPRSKAKASGQGQGLDQGQHDPTCKDTHTVAGPFLLKQSGSRNAFISRFVRKCMALQASWQAGDAAVG